MAYLFGRSGRPSILGIVYSDGAAAGRMMSDLGYRLRGAGVAVAGIVSYRPAVEDGEPAREVEELASRIILELSDSDQSGNADVGIDAAAAEEAAALIASAFRKSPQLLIVGAFGQLEADGGGLAEVISNAVDLGIPVIAGVAERHVECWRGFTGGLAEEVPMDSLRVQQWLARRGLAATPPRHHAAHAALLNSAA